MHCDINSINARRVSLTPLLLRAANRIRLMRTCQTPSNRWRPRMRTLGHGIVALTLVVAVAACAPDEAEPEGENTMAADSPAAHSGAAHGATGATQLSAADSQVVNDVRRTADQYRDLAAARAAGYSKQYPEGCVQTADGSQGFHFIKESLVDDRVELNTPELVMYEPKADGSMELIGVDYVIPFDRW